MLRSDFCSYDKSRANPSIVSYNASVVNNYKATSSLVRFESKNVIFYFEKNWRCSCKVVGSILRLVNLQLQCQRSSRLECSS
jgi:hypothetical protein